MSQLKENNLNSNFLISYSQTVYHIICKIGSMHFMSSGVLQDVLSTSENKIDHRLFIREVHGWYVAESRMVESYR